MKMNIDTWLELGQFNFISKMFFSWVLETTLDPLRGEKAPREAFVVIPIL